MKFKKLNEDLKIITDFSDYEPWSGAVDTYERIVAEDKLDELESILEEMYPDGIGVTELNDILWFEPETIYEWLGIEENEEENESLNEDEHNKEDIIDERAKEVWLMHNVLRYMNDENAYMRWIYLFPDDADELEVPDFVETEEEYMEFVNLFKKLYKTYHDDGLFRAPIAYLEYAHEWDKKLGLSPIENLR